MIMGKTEAGLAGIAGLAIALAASLAEAKEPQTFKDCDTCPEMVVVPAGRAMLGSYETEAYRRKDERPKQEARIRKPFAIAKTEITVGQYRQFMTETNHQKVLMVYNGRTYRGCNYFNGKGYGYVQNHHWDNPGFPQHEDAPVVCVSWSDADAFAKWLSDKTGRAYRVPSTVEFEYAMRAGSQAPWAWGTDPSGACEYANIADETLARTYPKRASFGCDDGYLFSAPVGAFKPNSYGLHDMLGNAWEWTNDCWHEDLKQAPLDGRSWLSENDGDCNSRTPKGGGWISGPAWARAPVHSRDLQHYRSFMLGFRLAADAQ